MRKTLLTTTALVAVGAFAGAFAGAAQADEMMAEPISVSLGGYYHSAFIFVANDDKTDRGHGLLQDIELEVAGSTTLDNGITAGVRIRIEGDSPGSSNAGETEVTLSSGFGRISYGSVEGAAQNGTIWSPGGSAIGGVKSAWFGTSVYGWTTGAMGEDAMKVSYYSPAFNGISFGVSYSPENTTKTRGDRKNNDMSTTEDGVTTGAYGEGIQAALNYSVDVMGGSFAANVGYEAYTSENDDFENATATRFGASLSIDQIVIGGAMQTRSAYSSEGDEVLSDVGIQWAQGPISLAVGYGSHEKDMGDNKVVTSFGAGYNLGTGIDVAGKFNMVEVGNKDSSEFLLGTFINF